MNDKHQGPHCAGSCEGAAYQIEIRKLRAENEALRDALKDLLAITETDVDEPDECSWARQVLDANNKEGK